ncbi:MAG TPA: phosphoenolpyruvate--protein phosphotransferase, partial [Treponema sp.]|nr:phosphoenolpyruvate--protein phosphotransferase [Treponema sp.]
TPRKTEDMESEVRQLTEALDRAAEELSGLYSKALNTADDSVADIFMIHGMMLQDDDFRNRMTGLITKDGLSAEAAVSRAAAEFAEDLSKSGSDYIAQRGADISDLEHRVIRILAGRSAVQLPDADEKIILAADEITPSLTLMFERSQLLGLVSGKGSATSHAAILARSLGIPAVIASGTVLDSTVNGVPCIVDGVHGNVIFSPDVQQLEDADMRRKKYELEQQELLSLRTAPAETESGQKVTLYCNAGSLDDIDRALECGAEGIGLFRSEFLYLGRSELPTEEELADVYTKAVRKLDGRKLVVRTLDIGADKKTDCIPMKPEPNPALGIRALRLCFAMPDLFSVQLRAVLRAAANGPVSVMFPMICSVSEIRRAKACLTAAADDLEKRKIPHADRLETGIMVETPAAAVISDLLAGEADFFSIGSNDLTQYTLAVDRQNEDAAAYCDPHHESVMRLIELTVKNAHEHGIWCGICGELGADTSVTGRFVQAGIDELSVSPRSLLRLKKKIRELP